MTSISIIIPTLNEAGVIVTLIGFLNEHSNGLVKEIIVSDGGSSDDTLKLAKQAGANAVIGGKGKGCTNELWCRDSNWWYSLFCTCRHIPPSSYAKDIIEAVKTGYSFGRYRTKFDSSKKILLLNAWFTRFDLFICYGGDQTLFIVKQLFNEIGGFNKDMRIMEDYDIVVRAKEAKAKYKIFNKPALVSARKYETNSWLRCKRLIISLSACINEAQLRTKWPSGIKHYCNTDSNSTF